MAFGALDTLIERALPDTILVSDATAPFLERGFELVEHHGDESDDQRHALAEHEAALKTLEKFANDGVGDSKTSSFVWLFLRTRGANEASGGR